MENILIAEDGMRLTNGVIFGKEIVLGNGMSEDDFWLITEEEYREMKRKQREAENEE